MDRHEIKASELFIEISNFRDVVAIWAPAPKTANGHLKNLIFEWYVSLPYEGPQVEKDVFLSGEIEQHWNDILDRCLAPDQDGRKRCRRVAPHLFRNFLAKTSKENRPLGLIRAADTISIDLYASTAKGSAFETICDHVLEKPRAMIEEMIAHKPLVLCSMMVKVTRGMATSSFQFLLQALKEATPEEEIKPEDATAG